jgi:predicted nucleotidyltransferase
LLLGERRFHVRRRDLFGSAAGNDYDPARSDLDFLVEFGAAATGTYADAFFGLKESLEQLFGRPVWSPPQPSAIPISAKARRAPRSCSMWHEEKRYLYDVG